MDNYWLDGNDARIRIYVPTGNIIEASLEEIGYIAKFGGINNGILRYYFDPTIFPEDHTESLPNDKNDMFCVDNKRKYVRLSVTMINPMTDWPDCDLYVTRTLPERDQISL